MFEIISDKNVKIRKPHKCIVCARRFEVGTIMHNQVNKYDSIASVYTCETCQELIKCKFLLLNDENGYDSECFAESKYQDNFSGTPEEYFEFKTKQKSDLIKLQSECLHGNLKQDYEYRNF